MQSIIDKKKCRVSVAMAVHNGEKYLKEQIESVLVNLSDDDELVISDDGSTDGTIKLISTNYGTNSIVKLLYSKRGGVKANFSNALNHCTGEYIFLCDQDDVWYSEKVAQVLPLLREHDLVVHDAVITDASGRTVYEDSLLKLRKAGSGVRKNIIRNSYTGCCMAFSRRLMKKSMPIPENIYMHDQWIGIMNDIYYKNSYFLNEPLIRYRRHDDNVTDMRHHNPVVMIRRRRILIEELMKRMRMLRMTP